MLVSATPSANTVRFYQGRGFGLMAEPLPELFERESVGVHMRKAHGAVMPPTSDRHLGWPVTERGTTRSRGRRCSASTPLPESSAG
jgi:hypothetical protein